MVRPTDEPLTQHELSPDSIAHLDELKGEMQCKVSSFNI